MAVILNATRVHEIFIDCLFRKGEDTTNHIPAWGITISAGFHPVRLDGHRAEITAMLFELPEQFMSSNGGGWSFLNACHDKNGVQWGEHINMQELFLLGLGIGKVKCLLLRDMWHAMPGGMPYYVVLDTEPVGTQAESGNAAEDPQRSSPEPDQG